MVSISTPPQPSALRWLAAAGIIGPVVFALVSLAHSLLRPGHALLSDPMSALAAGPSGWVQGLIFAVSGLLMIAFAVGIHLAVRPSRAGFLGPIMIAVFGMGLIGLAVFPATDADGRYVSDRLTHNLSALVAFASASFAPLVLSWRLARDPWWSPLARYIRLVGIVLVVLFVAGAILVVPPTAPYHDWLGLSQWLTMAVWYPTLIVLGWRAMQTPPANR